MALVTTTVNLPVEMWEKSRQYHINRSAFAREAIGKEIARIENEAGVVSGKTSPDCRPLGGHT